MSAIDLAMNYVRDEYHSKLSQRDRMGILVKERLASGDVLGAISGAAQQERLAGQVDGLNTAIAQLQMIREEMKP